MKNSAERQATPKTLESKKPTFKKFIKYPLIGIASLYLAANAFKPIIGQAILEYAFQNNEVTKSIEEQKGFPENINKNTTKASYYEEYSENTYVSSGGEQVKYIETNENTLESQKGKILVVFVGIDNNIPSVNREIFEKRIYIYYDTKKLSKDGIILKGKAVSEMLKKNYNNKQLSLLSTSFGSLFSSYLDEDLKFEQRIAFAPFVGESELVKEVTGLPLPVSIFWGDQYDNFLQKPYLETKVIIGDRDGLTGGRDVIQRTFPNVEVLPNINHMGNKIGGTEVDKIKFKFRVEPKKYSLWDKIKLDEYFKYIKDSKDNYFKFSAKVDSTQKKDFLFDLEQDFIRLNPSNINKVNRFSNSEFLEFAAKNQQIKMIALKYWRTQLAIDVRFDSTKK